MRYDSGRDGRDGPFFARVFLTARATCGFVSWDGGRIDITPGFVYGNSLPYEREDSALLVG